MMRGAKASAITESLYQRWTEILSKLSDEFAEKIGRPKPLLKSPRSFGQKRRYRSPLHFCSKQYRGVGGPPAQAPPSNAFASETAKFLGMTGFAVLETYLAAGPGGMGDGDG